MLVVRLLWSMQVRVHFNCSILWFIYIFINSWFQVAVEVVSFPQESTLVKRRRYLRTGHLMLCKVSLSSLPAGHSTRYSRTDEKQQASRFKIWEFAIGSPFNLSNSQQRFSVSLQLSDGVVQTTHLSNEKKPGGLGCIGDYTTYLCCDYNKPTTRITIKQPFFSRKVTVLFFVAHLKNGQDASGDSSHASSWNHGWALRWLEAMVEPWDVMIWAAAGSRISHLYHHQLLLLGIGSGMVGQKNSRKRTE